MTRSETRWWLLALPWCRLTIDWRPKRNWRRSSKTCRTRASGCVTRDRSYSRLIPRALVAFWGFSDITGDWVSKPNALYRPPLITREEARKAVGTKPLTTPAAENSRGRFFLYCRQQGVWPQEVAGLDPAKDARAFDRFCPIRNVTVQYPPTLLIHGTKD